MKVPRNLRVSRSNDVMIKTLSIGKVEKKSSGDWLFTSEGSYSFIPKYLKARTVREIKEQLTTAIPRVDYINILESQPE